MQTTDMGDIHLMKGLLDCGASDMFMSSDFVKWKHLMTKLLTHPIPVYNVDVNLNKVGSISKVVNVMLQYCDHSECATFAVTSISTHNLILGLNWLQKHNLEVDWVVNKVKMSCCPTHCRTCQSEVNAERKTLLKEAVSICLCCTGPMPSPDIVIEDIPDLVPDKDNEDDKPYIGDNALEEGDQIFVATIPCEVEFIQAMLNISQRLAEAFHKNAEPKSFHKSVLRMAC